MTTNPAIIHRVKFETNKVTIYSANGILATGGRWQVAFHWHSNRSIRPRSVIVRRIDDGRIWQLLPPFLRFRV